MHKKLGIGAMLLTLSFLVIPMSQVYGNETSTYRFDLAKGKNADVCRHMHKVYNSYFQQLFDIEKAKPELQDMFTRTYRYVGNLGAIYSFYPTGPEFDALPERIALLSV